MIILAIHPSLAHSENGDGLTPLGFAAHFGSKATVQVLLDYGADVNAVSHSKLSYIPSNTALHAAIAGERDPEVIRLLLTRGALTNIFDSSGHTCLHTAAFHDDNTELIRLLMEHGARLTDVTGALVRDKHRSSLERLLNLIKRHFVIVERFFQHLPHNLPRSVG
ncbi:Ankyrin repeat-containing protein [Paenibacillus tianmuensis]|uniref:Ankyrin repeat-containing protein n=1 Tax=Paenibacillus tianmuensis TaxID=624147 RepID=A0A1G4U1X6_9BACL|nr:ankyrin repeat domain-containing protein [Paenibacillus tianmuensis]SCW87673.1 Ankyrin repeat-containing protein [Paenibacillus tianmuensis]